MTGQTKFQIFFGGDDTEARLEVQVGNVEIHVIFVESVTNCAIHAMRLDQNT
jgi:hypothetical protein